MTKGTKIILCTGVVATVVYLVWQQQLNNKKSLVGLPPIKYHFKNFSNVSPEIIIKENKRLPTFGVPIIIKNR